MLIHLVFSLCLYAFTGDECLLLRRHQQGLIDGFSSAWTAGEVRGLEGAAVRAPYTEQWGGHTLHNAVVMSTSVSSAQCQDCTAVEYPEVNIFLSTIN